MRKRSVDLRLSAGFWVGGLKWLHGNLLDPCLRHNDMDKQNAMRTEADPRGAMSLEAEGADLVPPYGLLHVTRAW